LGDLAWMTAKVPLGLLYLGACLVLPTTSLGLSGIDQGHELRQLLASSAHDPASSRRLSELYTDGVDVQWRETPNAWHQSLARIVDHRFHSFDVLEDFALTAKKAGVSVLMLVEIHKTASCPGWWYGGLQLCEHINGSNPTAGGTIAQWQSLVQSILPMRLMWWNNPTYWSVQGPVWAEALTDKDAGVGTWFSWGDENCTEVTPCSGSNVVVPGVGCAQGSWGSDGQFMGNDSALASFGSDAYADYLVDAFANTWMAQVGIQGFTEDVAANYPDMLQTDGLGSLPYWAKIVKRVRQEQPQLVMSGENYSSWDQMLLADANIGGQGGDNYEGYHRAMQQAILYGHAEDLEHTVRFSGADGAIVVCYLHPGYDGKQPGGCPTMYFRDTSATMKDVKQHTMWVALETASGIVSQHDYDPESSCAGWTTSCTSQAGAWWNVTNDPFEEEVVSPIWKFTTERALNRLALRSKLKLGAAHGYTTYHSSNCYWGAGGVDQDEGPFTFVSLDTCTALCDSDEECSCVVFLFRGVQNGTGYGDCSRRAGCIPAQFTVASSVYTVLVKNQPAPSGYATYPQSNCYDGYGALSIDVDAVPVASAAECTQRCDDTDACDCTVYQNSTGDCWTRAWCIPAECQVDAAFTVYFKQRAGGALAYLKHDALGPFGDAAIVVFNPGEAQNVTVDLSKLPAELLTGTTAPYDLLLGTPLSGPALKSSWTVPMGAHEVKAFGGFGLGSFAPRFGKFASCAANYSRAVVSVTLQSCFLACFSDALCENVFVDYVEVVWMERPPPVTCTLLGSINDPSQACVTGSGTLIRQFRYGRLSHPIV